MSQTKRKLTKSEINNILDFIQPQKGIPEDTAISIVNKLKNQFRQQLENKEIYPKLIPLLKRELTKQYRSTVIQAGESVGILTAQCIGERQTQSTLNSFHHSGLTAKTVITGVPRFTELINVTQSPKAQSCTIYFVTPHKDLGSLRQVINHNLVGLTLKNLLRQECSSHTKIFDSNKYPKPAEPWYESYKILYSSAFESYECGISLFLDIEKLYRFSLDISYIAQRIEEEYTDLLCVYSPNNLGRIDVFVDTSSITLPEDRILFIDESNAIEICLDEVVIPNLEKIQICGIQGIEHIFYAKKGDEWIVETEGSNFRKIISNPLVDKTRTISNNVWEIYETLGIEASRQFLIEEFGLIIDEFINPAHLKILVDVMTFSGTLTSITRYGIKREQVGPLAKASFEECLDNFLKAGVYGETETTDGVSASIVCGKFAQIGTGLCQLRIDVDKLLQVSSEPPTIESVEI